MNEEDKKVLGVVMNLHELQAYQDIFCMAQKIYLKCFDMAGMALTKLSGKESDLSVIYDLFGKFNIKQMLQEMAVRAAISAVPVWKNTEYTNIKLVGVPNIVEGEHQGVWAGIIIYHCDEFAEAKDLFDTGKMAGCVTKEEAGRAITLLRMLATKFIVAAYDNNRAVKKLKEIKEQECRIKDELQRKETTNHIFELLEKDGDFESVLSEVLCEVADYLQISNAMITKADRKNDNITIIGEWHGNEIFDMDDIKKKLVNDILAFHKDERILVAEYNTDNNDLRMILKKYKIKSLLSVPILVGREPDIYAIFAETRYDRNWSTNTERFLFDVCKMIQSMMFKRIAKNSLVSSYAALKEILNNLGSGIFVIDKTSRKILFHNDIIAKMSGHDMVGYHCYDFHYGEFAEQCKYCIPLKRKNYFTETFDEKMERWYEVKYNDITWVDGREVSLCNVTDVTDKKKYQQRIEFQANNDFLTGLFNRMRCEEDLQVCVMEAVSTRTKGAILFIDLDDFKHINDGLGHQYGDVLLKMISVGLQQIEGIEKRCYRVGGDEFIIIIEPAVYHRIEEIISEIQKLFSKPWYLGDAEYYCTMSMGIVTFADNGSDVNDLIKKADIAMYDAKKSGKNRYVRYNKGEDRFSYIKLDIEKNMRSAVASRCNEFEIYIQPIVDIKTEQCMGGEALVRWNSRKLGFLSPGDFIPLAEHLGLITPIGEYVLRQSCMLSKKWSDKGIDIHINVNLSIVQLLANNVVDTIADIISKTGAKTENLVLEVTESLAINDMSRMKKIIKDIKALGIHIALDDFGTGYSSLNYIKQMDLDIIKVDRTFIKDIAEDDYARAFVKLIAELSSQLKVQVCVEGVENKKQLDVLKELNIDMIQGFYFGKPMKIQEFEAKYLGI